MKSTFLILSVTLFLGFSTKTEAGIYERVYVHTDKSCYLAGETIWLKFYVIDSDFQPSFLSKVGYIEISDTEKPQMQLKLELEKGHGAGMIKIPMDIPSGMYQLSAYTRYMKNEGENVFFKKQIAVINAGQLIPNTNRFVLVDNFEKIQSVEKEQTREILPAGLLIKTDQNEYGIRKKVLLSLDNIPDNTEDLVISVSRNDSIALVPEINKLEWLKQVKDTLRFSQQWLPEYEGHIITGRFVPELQGKRLLSSIAFVGDDIRYINGKIDSTNGTVSFYTAGISGKQQIVTSAISMLYDKVPHRVDLLTPFCEFLPERLPVLSVYPNEKQLIERYIGVQILEKANNDSIENPIQPSGYCTLQPALSYDLDEYTRFGSISETILEFINRVRVAKVGNIRKIKVYMLESNDFNRGNTLVLLDGIPVYDHEDILRYNPMYIKKIDIYDGRFIFGGEHFECIVSFVTREADLSFFQLNDEIQLFNYDCPMLPLSIENTDYSTTQSKNSREPDFRHTLYWNPMVDFKGGQTLNLAFYTSDLCGEFKVSIEGFTTDGKMIQGTSYFLVSEPSGEK